MTDKKTIKELQEEVKRIKLEKQLKKLRPEPDKQIIKKIRSESEELEEDIQKSVKKRTELVEKIGKAKQKTKGFFGKVGLRLRAGAAIARVNKEIYQKKKILGTRGDIKGLKVRRELEEERAKLKKLQEKNKIDFDNISKPIQAIKQEDIFGY